MIILDGKQIAQKIYDDIAKEFSTLKIEHNKSVPRLEIIMVGDSFASRKYVEYKKLAGENLGFEINVNLLDATVTDPVLTELINKFNRDPKVNGIMVQLPIPDTLDETLILDTILPQKDVDGLTSMNLGRLFQQKDYYFAPATAMAVMELLTNYGISAKGKNVAVVGAGKVVGLPIAALLLREGATVSILNTNTQDVPSYTCKSDIIIAAAGAPRLIKSDWVKEGAVVVDVGFSQDELGKAVGDVDFDGVAPKTSFISKVTGGVGPVTVASLIKNTFGAWKKSL